MSGVDFPNIRRLLGPYLKKLERLPADEYVVLRHELADPKEYAEALGLLDAHLKIAEDSCEGFDRLLGEKRKLGTNIDGVNAAILDKLAEIRAIVGLNEFAFEDIEFSASPDLAANQSGEPYAIEVTRISATGGIQEPSDDIQIKMLTEGDNSDVLWRQIVSKALGKRDQFIRAGLEENNHIVWISTGRDYFVAGRYEPELAGLRKNMPKHLIAMTELARTDTRLESEYPELAYLAISPGRDGSPVLVQVNK